MKIAKGQVFRVINSITLKNDRINYRNTGFFTTFDKPIKHLVFLFIQQALGYTPNRCLLAIALILRNVSPTVSYPGFTSLRRG